MTITLTFENAVTTDEVAVIVGSNVMAGEIPGGGVSHRVPPVLAGGQAYRWSAEWQRAELEALAALEAGEARSFTDPNEALLWLLSEDDG